MHEWSIYSECYDALQTTKKAHETLQQYKIKHSKTNFYLSFSLSSIFFSFQKNISNLRCNTLWQLSAVNKTALVATFYLFGWLIQAHADDLSFIAVKQLLSGANDVIPHRKCPTSSNPVESRCYIPLLHNKGMQTVTFYSVNIGSSDCPPGVCVYPLGNLWNIAHNRNIWPLKYFVVPPIILEVWCLHLSKFLHQWEQQKFQYS